MARMTYNNYSKATSMAESMKSEGWSTIVKAVVGGYELLYCRRDGQESAAHGTDRFYMNLHTNHPLNRLPA